MEIFNNVPANKIKKKEYKYFPVFSDNYDTYFNVGESYNINKEIALNHAKKLKNEGSKNIRVYYVHEEEDYRDGIIEQLIEDCIYSIGNYPN